MYTNSQRLTIFSIFIWFCSLSSHGQDASFPSKQHYLDHIERAADSLFRLKKSVQPDEALQNLSQTRTVPVISRQAPRKRKISPRELYTMTKPAVLIIGMLHRKQTDSTFHKNLASGYVIDPRGICVTNYHVIATYANSPKDADYVLLAQNGLGRNYAVKQVLYCSAEEDLAILQLDLGGDEPSLPSLPLADAEPEVGDPVFVLANPDGLFFYFSDGILANRRLHNVYVSDLKRYVDRKMYSITADYAVGSSGGPILDEKGNVIATVSSTSAISPPYAGSATQMVVKNVVPSSSLKRFITISK